MADFLEPLLGGLQRRGLHLLHPLQCSTQLQSNDLPRYFVPLCSDARIAVIVAVDAHPRQWSRAAD